MREALIKNDEINKVELTLTEAVNVGDVVAFGDVVVVAGTSGVVGDTIICYKQGIFEVKAKADDTFEPGDKVYFDLTNRYATAAADGNKYLGLAYGTKDSGVDVLRVGVGA